jgi:hypothetical protein
MANMHVLQRGGGGVTVVMHVAVPNANNAVGQNWRTVLIASHLGGTTVLPDGDGTAGTISATEKATIASGSVYETVVTLRPEQVAFGALPAWLDLQYAQASAAALALLEDQLNYYGYTR